MCDSIPTEFRRSNAEGLLWPGVIGTAILAAVFAFTDAITVTETWVIGFVAFLIGGYWLQLIWRQIHPTVYLTTIEDLQIRFVRENMGTLSTIKRNEIRRFCTFKASRIWQRREFPWIIYITCDGRQVDVSQLKIQYSDQDDFLRAVASKWGVDFVCSEDLSRLGIDPSLDHDEHTVGTDLPTTTTRSHC